MLKTITKINLTEDVTSITLTGGSAVQGQSTFVMDGVRQTVVSSLLMAEALGHRVVEAVSMQRLEGPDPSERWD